MNTSTVLQRPVERPTNSTDAIAVYRPKTSRGLGFLASLLTAVLAVATFAAGIMTPPRSGPFCSGSCVTYPYTDVAAFVPRDYWWMYPASVLALTFVMLTASLRQYANADRKLFGQLGLTFAAIAAALITADYFIQLAVIQPSLQRGEAEGLSLFSQYNPQGIFIALEDLGYFMMSVAFLFMGLVFVRRTALERELRWLFVIGAVAGIGALIVLSVIFGQDLEYRFEVTVLAINWTILIVSGVLLSALFNVRRMGSSERAAARTVER